MTCPHCGKAASGAIRDPQALAVFLKKDRYVTCVVVCGGCARMWPARKNPGLPWLD